MRAQGERYQFNPNYTHLFFSFSPLPWCFFSHIWSPNLVEYVWLSLLQLLWGIALNCGELWLNGKFSYTSSLFYWIIQIQTKKNNVSNIVRTLPTSSFVVILVTSSFSLALRFSRLVLIKRVILDFNFMFPPTLSLDQLEPIWYSPPCHLRTVSHSGVLCVLQLYILHTHRLFIAMNLLTSTPSYKCFIFIGTNGVLVL